MLTPLEELTADTSYRPHNGCIETADMALPAFGRIVDEMHRFIRVPRRKLDNFSRCKGPNWLEPAWIGAYRHWEYPWAILNGRLARGLRVLDSGAGNGALQFYLTALGLEVCAHDAGDLRSKQVKRLERLARALGLGWRANPTAPHRRLNRFYGVEVRYTPADAAALPYRDASFDRVFSISVLEHMPDDVLRRAMAEMERVLKPGGLLVLTFDFHAVPAPWLIGFTAEEFHRKILGACRLRIVGSPPRLDFPDWPGYVAELNRFFRTVNGNTACGVLLEKA